MREKKEKRGVVVAGIATMALFRDPNPYTPFYRRVHTFITQHLYGLEA
jgi:hypothetical protein